MAGAPRKLLWQQPVGWIILCIMHALMAHGMQGDKMQTNIAEAFLESVEHHDHPSGGKRKWLDGKNDLHRFRRL